MEVGGGARNDSSPRTLPARPRSLQDSLLADALILSTKTSGLRHQGEHSAVEKDFVRTQNDRRRVRRTVWAQRRKEVGVGKVIKINAHYLAATPGDVRL